ncbi:MAG: hypothetical protein NTV09_09165 [Bacteroidetes bacterium]|nr:hypothetical protein [Bacteroidota bacterium]
MSTSSTTQADTFNVPIYSIQILQSLVPSRLPGSTTFASLPQDFIPSRSVGSYRDRVSTIPIAIGTTTQACSETTSGSIQLQERLLTANCR